MRTFIGRSLLAGLACAAGACSSANTKTVSPAATQADEVGAPGNAVMQYGGVNVLSLTAPADFHGVAGDGTLHFESAHYSFDCWLIPGVQTVDEATARVGPLIAGQFKNFQADRTIDFTVAGSPARELTGAGNEADDDDPGRADLIVFKVGSHLFVACDHGEILKPDGEQLMAALVQTARLP